MTKTDIQATEFVLHVHQHIIPAALDLLPGKMTSNEARAMMLAIGLQESRFKYRVQVPNGPAHGFWQFERGGGVRAVLRHDSTRPIILPILSMFGYKADVSTSYRAIVHNDVLAAIFARLLLWTVPGKLATSLQETRAWAQYIDGWRPGKPHPETWPQCHAVAWDVVKTE